jgi:adenosylhomocysteine nucleosidase
MPQAHPLRFAALTRLALLLFVLTSLGLFRAAAAEVPSASTASSAAEPSAPASTRPLIAILNAYPPEMEAMITSFGLKGPEFTPELVRGFRFYRGPLEGHEVLVVETGMSPVNAAMALQIALLRYPVTHVLFAGVAGGLDPALEVGDVVIPERWAYHDEAAYFNEDGKGGHHVADYFKKKYPNFGKIHPDDVVATRASTPGFVRVPTFPADPELLDAARRALEKLGPVKGERTGRTLRIEIGGTGVTGSVFVDHAGYREHLFNTWGARSADMESTAYAQVAYTNEVPFLAIRALSDLAGGQEGKNVIDDYEHTSSVNAVRVLRAILREL